MLLSEGLRGPRQFFKWALLPQKQLAGTRAATGQADTSTSSDSEPGTRNPALALPTAAARQQRGFQVPAAQEGILEQTLRLPQRVFTE